MYDAYQAQFLICDQQIAQVLIKLSQEKVQPSEPLPKLRHKSRQPNALNFDVRTLLYLLVGVVLPLEAGNYTLPNPLLFCPPPQARPPVPVAWLVLICARLRLNPNEGDPMNTGTGGD